MTVYQLWATGTDYLTCSRQVSIYSATVFTGIEAAKARAEKFREAAINLHKLLDTEPIKVTVQALEVIEGG